jgi:hypothetical protein
MRAVPMAIRGATSLGSATVDGYHDKSYDATMPPSLLNILQQFGREIVTGAPAAMKFVKREYEIARDPYVDKFKYWFGSEWAAQLDADDHRQYDTMTAEQKLHLAGLQAGGSWPPFESVKPKHQRPWTGASQASSDATTVGGVGEAEPAQGRVSRAARASMSPDLDEVARRMRRAADGSSKNDAP